MVLVESLDIVGTQSVRAGLRVLVCVQDRADVGVLHWHFLYRTHSLRSAVVFVVPVLKIAHVDHLLTPVFAGVASLAIVVIFLLNFLGEEVLKFGC